MLRFIIAVLGMALFLEGLPYFLFPEKTKKLLGEIKELPTAVLRGLGFVLLALGLVITLLSRKIGSG